MSGPLVDLNGRVRDRGREQRQRRVTIGMRIVAVLGGLAVLGWVATGSPLFSVKQVVVTGNTVVPTATIVDAAHVPMGVPLAQVDAAGIAARLADVPGVGRGVVGVRLPDTVTIAVTERSIAFVVPTGGGYAWIDSTGLRFGESRAKPSGVPQAEADPDDRALLADVATVLGALAPPLSQQVSTVRAQTRDSIVLKTTRGLTITWGSADQSPLKGQAASALVRATPSCKAIDVSSPTHPTTRC